MSPSFGSEDENDFAQERQLMFVRSRSVGNLRLTPARSASLGVRERNLPNNTEETESRSARPTLPLKESAETDTRQFPVHWSCRRGRWKTGGCLQSLTSLSYLDIYFKQLWNVKNPPQFPKNTKYFTCVQRYEAGVSHRSYFEILL